MMNLTGRWHIPGTHWANVVDDEPYNDFVWCMGRATWDQQSKIGWPWERRTHYIGRHARFVWPELWQ